jgi:hypothetical protein
MAGHFLVMCHHDYRGSLIAVDVLEELHHLGRGAAIEVAGWFIRQEEQGTMDQGTGQGDALLFTAAELARPVARAPSQTNLVQGLSGTPIAFLSVDSLQRQGQGDVGCGCHARDKVKGLEDEADGCATVQGTFVGFQGTQVPAIDAQATGGRGVQAAEQMEQRRLPRSTDADNGQPFTALDVEVDTVQ